MHWAGSRQWGWPCETMVVVNIVTVVQRCWGTGILLGSCPVGEPRASVREWHAPHLLLFLQLLLWEDEAVPGGTEPFPGKKDRLSLLR